MKIFLLIVTVGTAVAGIVKDKDKDLPSEPSLSSKANIDSSQIEDRQDKQDSLLTPVLHQTKPDSLPEILVNNPTTGLSVQTLPSPIQFAQAVPKQPYIPGQNKQQFTKPFPATPDTPLYYLLRSDSQTKPYPAVTNSEYNPQILVNNPNTGLSVQTLPSPVQFAQAVAKQPYAPGQNKQQYTKPFPADSDNSQGYNPQLLVNNPGSAISAQTLPSPIQFAEPDAKQNFVLLNPIRQTRPAPQQLPGFLPQVLQQTRPIEDTVLTRSGPASFLPGVSTRPSYPPGYTVARNTPPTDTASEYSGLKTLLYIF